MQVVRTSTGGPGAPPGRRRRLLLVGLLGVVCRSYEALDLRTGRTLRSVTSEVESGGWEVAWSDEAAWLTIASPYRVDLRAGAVARAWPVQSLANCENIGGKIVCTR
jgi:hypothetical protein